MILIPRSMVGIGIQNQLGIGHVLNEIKGIHRLNNNIVVSAHD